MKKNKFIVSRVNIVYRRDSSRYGFQMPEKYILEMYPTDDQDVDEIFNLRELLGKRISIVKKERCGLESDMNDKFDLLLKYLVYEPKNVEPLTWEDLINLMYRVNKDIEARERQDLDGRALGW